MGREIASLINLTEYTETTSDTTARETRNTYDVMGNAVQRRSLVWDSSFSIDAGNSITFPAGQATKTEVSWATCNERNEWV